MTTTRRIRRDYTKNNGDIDSEGLLEELAGLRLVVQELQELQLWYTNLGAARIPASGVAEWVSYVLRHLV